MQKGGDQKGSRKVKAVTKGGKRRAKQGLQPFQKSDSRTSGGTEGKRGKRNSAI